MVAGNVAASSAPPTATAVFFHVEEATAARQRGIVWLHVDYEPELRALYAAGGFTPTEAGVMRLGPG